MTDPPAGSRQLPRAARSRVWLAVATGLIVIHAWFCHAGSGPSTETPLSSAIGQLRLDPNRATVDELQLLPRIGPKIAERIVAYRESVTDPPAFRTAEDLDKVKFIGPVTVERLRPLLRFPDDPIQPQSERATP